MVAELLDRCAQAALHRIAKYCTVQIGNNKGVNARSEAQLASPTLTLLLPVVCRFVLRIMSAHLLQKGTLLTIVPRLCLRAVHLGMLFLSYFLSLLGFLLFLHRPTTLELIAVGSNVTLKRENVCVCIYRDAVDKSRCSGVAYPFTHLFVRCTLYFLSSAGFLGELLALLRFGICAR